MTSPTNDDISINDEDAEILYNKAAKTDSGWCLADIIDVKNNMAKVNYPIENLVFVKGKVEDSIPNTIPNNNISLLRLDTDFYESTKHELNFLYPKLSENGVLIIDDFGHWKGCKKAVNEYFADNKIHMLLNRIDYSGRMGIKNN